MKLLFGNSWESKPVTMWRMTGKKKKKHESYPSTFKAKPHKNMHSNVYRNFTHNRKTWKQAHV